MAKDRDPAILLRHSGKLSASLLPAGADVMLSIRRSKLFKNQHYVRQRIGSSALSH